MFKLTLEQYWLPDKDALSMKKNAFNAWFKDRRYGKVSFILMSFALIIFIPLLFCSCVHNNSSLPDGVTVEFADTNLETAIREELDIPDGDITEQDMLGLTSLGALRLEIECLDGLEYAANLERLWLTSNAITDISPLAELTELRVLWLDKNDITDITPLEKLTKLNMLKLEFNNIIDISPLAGLTELELLLLHKNEITDIAPLEKLNELMLLELGSNSIADLSPLSGLTNLKSLVLNSNKISDLSPVAELTDLKTLYLRSNEITELSPLAELTNLEDLRLGENNIKDLSPLAELPEIKRLLVESNSITDIASLAELPEMKRLNVESNLITDISPLIENEGITSWGIVRINSNPLSSATYSEYIPELKNRGLRVHFDKSGEIHGIHFDKPGEIYGTVFHSQKGKGVEGITVFLDIDQDGELDSWEVSTTTSSDGTYSFAPIGPYDYQIRIITEDEWSVELPADKYHPVNLSEDEVVMEKDFELKRIE